LLTQCSIVVGFREEKKIKKSIAMTPVVLKRVDEAARREGRSRSNYIDRVLVRHFGLEEVSTPLARTSR